MLTMKSVVRLVFSGAVVVSLVLSTGGEVVARPKYKAAADSLYPELAKKHGTDGKLICALCHPEKEKKVRNNYGAGFGKGLEKKNETDEAKIKEAFTKAEKLDSATKGKTFGDLIKSN